MGEEEKEKIFEVLVFEEPVETLVNNYSKVAIKNILSVLDVFFLFTKSLPESENYKHKLRSVVLDEVNDLKRNFMLIVQQMRDNYG